MTQLPTSVVSVATGLPGVPVPAPAPLPIYPGSPNQPASPAQGSAGNNNGNDTGNGSDSGDGRDGGDYQSNECNTGPVQCCNSVVDSNDESATSVMKSLGISLSDVTGSVGLTCTPITVLGGLAGGKCSSTPVCCKNNSYGGLINIGCVPIIL
ncbi:fungal hydrophobin-domain-containing protein [Trametes punicea]|nr:fungal hydrophobin-domain-containing protein [Trametes punicea]